MAQLINKKIGDEIDLSKIEAGLQSLIDQALSEHNKQQDELIAGLRARILEEGAKAYKAQEELNLLKRQKEYKFIPSDKVSSQMRIDRNGYTRDIKDGLTKREYFIGQALAGMSNMENPYGVAMIAVQIADHVCKRLSLESEEEK